MPVPSHTAWSGSVKHRLDTGDGRASTVELFSGTANFPEAILEQMPPVVFVRELASRDTVRLKRHTVHHLTLAGITQKQHLKLMVSPNCSLDHDMCIHCQTWCKALNCDE